MELKCLDNAEVCALLAPSYPLCVRVCVREEELWTCGGLWGEALASASAHAWQHVWVLGYGRGRGEATLSQRGDPVPDSNTQQVMNLGLSWHKGIQCGY